MHIRTRRVLFWLAVIFFVVAAYGVVQYALGYTWDFAIGKFVRTGALAVTANVDAKLFINDRPAGETSFIAHRAGRSRLAPGVYIVRLVRDGYSSWRKTAQVSEGLLTDFPSVMLLPIDDASLVALRAEATAALASPSIEPFVLRKSTLYHRDGNGLAQIAQGVLGAGLAQDASRILWYTRNDVWVLWLTNTDYQPFHSEGDRLLIARFGVPIVGAGWFRDRDHIVIGLDGDSYRVLETDTRGGINIIRF